MAEAETRRITPEEFFEWQKRQDRNYELGLDQIVELPEIGASLPLSELYEGVQFEAGLSDAR